MRRHITNSSRIYERGFTIIELVTVILILSILVAVSVDSAVGYQSGARDREREADTAVISQSIERYYRTNAVAVGATYPVTTVGEAGLTAIINDADATSAPDQTTSSLIIATSNAAQTPTLVQYIYQPLNVNNTLCTSVPCAKYKLYYRLEKDSTIVVQDSLRQQ